MSNNRESLRTIISKLSKDKNKKTIGYAVSDYEKVLDALKSAKIIVQKGESKTVLKSSWNTATINYTVLADGVITPNSSIEIDDISKPLVGNHVINKTKQVRCSLKSYMSFPLQYTEDGDDKNTVVEHEIFQDSRDIVRGRDITGQVKMPTKLLYDDSLANHQGNFKIGFCADFETFVTNYFNHFYAIEGKNNTWTIHNIKTIAEGYNLFVEVMKPISGQDGNSKVLHGMVVADTCMHQRQNDIPILSLYMPTPLFLLDDFKEFGGLKVKNNSKKMFQVNGEDVLFPFRDKKYDHKRGEINDYSPKSLEPYRRGDLKIYTLENDNKEYVSYVRFYFDISSKDYINELVFKKQMPNTEHFQKELFRGVKAEGDIYYRQEQVSYALGGVTGGAVTGDVNLDSPYWAPNQVNWDKFKQNYRRIKGKEFPAGHDDLIEKACKRHNLNTRMTLAQMYAEHGFTASSFVKLKNPGGLSVPGNTYKPGNRYKYPQLGGVEATVATSLRGEGYGRYWVFDTYEDAYHAKTYWVKVSTRYGTDKFKPQTVAQHYRNIANGGYAESSNYYELISGVYSSKSLFNYS